MKHCTQLLLGTALFLLPAVSSAGPLQDLLKSRGGALVQTVSVEQTSEEAFQHFFELVVDELERTGSGGLADSLRSVISDPDEAEVVRDQLAWIIHTFAREYYREAIIRETGQLIRFKTFATDVPNRMNPEFRAQKEYLRDLVGGLGLQFNDVDGYVQEIWIGGGEQSFGIMSHSDVQPVEPTEWTHDPWSGAVVDGFLRGRGSVDDKGPICAVIYGMRAILDSGFPIRRKIVLLIGTDEESANEDVATYLTTHAPPDRTIVVDSNFPVVCAEKGWGGIWLTLPRTSGAQSGGTRIVDLDAGFSASIVPEKATARLVVKNPDRDLNNLRILSEEFMALRAGSSINISGAQDTMIVTATGKSVHAS
ncbi:MAG: M20/M25/M40 family metallo-hydrolase, partial [Ignavibacteria bacterium]|nr:M20/M25/M40 family metallo-hydrolase [Ignavibacteria bacterium]